MTEQEGKNRRLKKTESVRQRAEKASTGGGKPRRLRSSAKGAGRPFKAVGKALSKVFKPFAFLLWPFKTRPMRFIGRILASVLLLKFIRESWAEVRQVTWPNRHDTIRLSLAVFMFSVAIGLVVAGVDYGLSKIFRGLIL